MVLVTGFPSSVKKTYISLSLSLVVVVVVVAAQTITYSVSWMLVNVVFCVLSWWRRFANNYLHWGALGTWLVLNVQGKFNPLITGTHFYHEFWA
ncbi:hypothetical protein E2C01_076248 [Portunus trituberculatus]|uniref:Uncharacterized protein n=1 Tax=Portunus trituberculatus TaxID=210409 RepID=A0A5B7I890_PORTR|nr:hypothetical protein [Portunus trituberculatus]